MQVTIRDNGIGIPRDQLPRVFAPFFTSKRKGLGLGLAARQTHRDALRRVRLDHERAGPGVARSWSSFPFTRADMSAAILIIEDELTLAKNIATYLKRGGYEASVASTGEDGLAQIDTLRPEAVLLDYALPGINGLDVLKRIKEIDPRIPVILMTGHGSELVAVEAMKAGRFDYLIKPVVLSELKLAPRADRRTGEARRGAHVSPPENRGRRRARSPDRTLRAHARAEGGDPAAARRGERTGRRRVARPS